MVMKRRVEIQIPFHDIDILHVVWHGHYVKYCEIARTALMQGFDLDWPRLKELGIAMPVVELHLQYRKPLLYNALIQVDAFIQETQYPELKVEYELRETQDGSLLATAWTRQIYFSVAEQQTLFTVPDAVASRFARSVL